MALAQAGFVPVILDNFSNSHRDVLERLRAITGESPLCEEGDVLRHARSSRTCCGATRSPAVIHFAGDKAVGESVAHPLKYYRNNIGGAVSLMQAMEATGCGALVFSSSATSTAIPASVPIAEDFPRRHTNPYGHYQTGDRGHAGRPAVGGRTGALAVLRYFNPVGAHASGLIGEDPHGIPNNLMPYIAQVAVGRRDVPAGLRQRLSDAGRHRRARLHPRRATWRTATSPHSITSDASERP